LLGSSLSERLGQQFIVEDRPGAGTNLATEAVVRALPDGYTLLMASSSNAINATLYDKLNFNFIRDIAPVALALHLQQHRVEHQPSRDQCKADQDREPLLSSRDPWPSWTIVGRSHSSPPRCHR
jgi:hypothetical protein